MELGAFSISLAVKDIKASKAFYEKLGFNAMKFGTSPPPESAPDVEYHWRPDNKALQTDRASQLSLLQRGG